MPFDSALPEPPPARDNLLRLARVLDDVPPRRYHHGSFKCLTTACALGWAVDKLGEEWGLAWQRDRYGSYLPSIDGQTLHECDDFFARVGELLGIEGSVAEGLFGGSEHSYGWTTPTPKIVARKLRQIHEELELKENADAVR